MLIQERVGIGSGDLGDRSRLPRWQDVTIDPPLVVLPSAFVRLRMLREVEAAEVGDRIHRSDCRLRGLPFRGRIGVISIDPQAGLTRVDPGLRQSQARPGAELLSAGLPRSFVEHVHVRAPAGDTRSDSPGVVASIQSTAWASGFRWATVRAVKGSLRDVLAVVAVVAGADGRADRRVTVLPVVALW